MTAGTSRARRTAYSRSASLKIGVDITSLPVFGSTFWARRCSHNWPVPGCREAGGIRAWVSRLSYEVAWSDIACS